MYLLFSQRRVTASILNHHGNILHVMYKLIPCPARGSLNITDQNSWPCRGVEKIQLARSELLICASEVQRRD